MHDNVTPIEAAKRRRGRPKKSSATSSPAESTPSKPTHWTESLAVRLTEEEKSEKSARLAQTVSHIEDLELERKEWMASQRTVIREARSDLRALARAVRLGEETREVEVTERPEFTTNMVRVVRVDTGECIRTRPMEPGARQVQLTLDAPLPSPRGVEHGAEEGQGAKAPLAETGPDGIASTMIRFDLPSGAASGIGDDAAEIDDPQAVLDAADKGAKPET